MRTVGLCGRAAILRSLSEANVRFIVVGEPDDAVSHDPASTGAAPLRIVVATHPTNLDALARSLDALGSSVRTTQSVPAPAPGGDVRRVGDPLGTIEVTTSGGDLDILLGGPRRPLYAQVAATAIQREIDGETVSWVAHVTPPAPSPRVTGDALGRRLAVLAGKLTHLGVFGDRRTPTRDTEEGATAGVGTAEAGTAPAATAGTGEEPAPSQGETSAHPDDGDH